MKKLMIIDGSSLLYRAFFALPPLKSATGQPTNAVYGFMTMLIKLFEDLQPDYTVVAFDKGKVTFRTDMYSDYKGNRPDAPDDLRPQFPLIREVLQSLGIVVIEKEGFEGDDIIGSLSKKLAGPNMQVHIITGDRDTLQLVDEHASVMLTKKGISDMLEVTTDNMTDLYGYGPDKVIQMKALMGDSSDNIPGVPGIGEKTALKLITAYGDLDGIYDHLDEVSGKKLKERLEEHKDLAYLSRTLATIKTDMDLEAQPEDFVVNYHPTEVEPLFQQLGFSKLTPRMTKALGGQDLGGADSLFASLDEVEPISYKGLAGLTEDYYRGKALAVHLTCDGKNPFLSIKQAFLYNGAEAIILDGADQKQVEALYKALQGASFIITSQAKDLLQVFALDKPANIGLKDKAGQARLFDLSLMAYLLDPTRTNYGILYLTERFQVPSIRPVGGDQESLSMVMALFAMAETAKEALQAENLWDLYADMELPLVRTLLVMEKNGIYIDPDKLGATRIQFKAEVQELQEDIYSLAGDTFNINSPKQLGLVLFEKLGLPVVKKTKTGYSTDAEVLEVLRPEHPIIEKILAYRSVTKLLSTYVEGLGLLINERTHRIHTSFNQMVTATGRLSSSEPNLQNIPVRTEKGRQIRALFLPGQGYDYLVSADYSQIELRILAHLCGDEALIKAFQEGADIHRFTAAEVLGKKLEDVTSEERSHAKAVNFGIIYGISDFGLSRDLGISRKAAKDYIELYFSRYPKVRAYMDQVIAKAHEEGKVMTMFGRIRGLDDINNRNFNRRSFAERMAMNTPIQGSAADIIKLAMNQVEARLEAEGYQSRMLLQVHDELLLEVVASEKEAVEGLLREVMEGVVSLSVPLVVDVNAAKDWALVK